MLVWEDHLHKTKKQKGSPAAHFGEQPVWGVILAPVRWR